MIEPMPTQACSVTDGKNAWTMEKAPMVRNEQILASNNVAIQLPPVRMERNNARINDRAAPEKMGWLLNHCTRRSNRSIKKKSPYRYGDYSMLGKYQVGCQVIYVTV